MNDDDLRRRFAELRREDAKRLPAFGAVTQRRRTNPARVLFAVVPALAAASIFVVWCQLPTASAPAPVARRPPPPRVQAAAALPLDFLLETAPARVRLDADPIEGLCP